MRARAVQLLDKRGLNMTTFPSLLQDVLEVLDTLLKEQKRSHLQIIYRETKEPIRSKLISEIKGETDV